MSKIDNYTVSLFKDSFLNLSYDHRLFVKKAFYCISKLNHLPNSHESRLYQNLFHPFYIDYRYRDKLNEKRKISFLKDSLKEWNTPKTRLELVNYYKNYYRLKHNTIETILSFYYDNLLLFIDSNRQTRLEIMRFLDKYDKNHL